MWENQINLTDYGKLRSEQKQLIIDKMWNTIWFKNWIQPYQNVPRAKLEWFLQEYA